MLMVIGVGSVEPTRWCTSSQGYVWFPPRPRQDKPCFMFGFSYHFNNLRFTQSQNLNDRSAAHVVSLFVSSEILKRKF